MADPELVIMSWWAFLDKSSIVGGDVAMVRIFLQHVNLQLDFFLFILKTNEKEEHEEGIQHAISHD